MSVVAQSRDYRRLPDPLVYLKELCVTCWAVIRTRQIWDRFIGADVLCALFGLALRGLGRVTHVTLWNVDFVPEGRFASRWKNLVYRWLTLYCSRRVDEVWDITDRLSGERERLLRLGSSQLRVRRVVQNGVWIQDCPQYMATECELSTVVYLGHLTEQQGVHLVLMAIPLVVNTLPDFQFRVIGSGAFENRLRELSTHLGIEQHVSFLGQIRHGPELNRLVARAGAGVAPYVRRLHKHAAFGDPSKVKTYLGCGVPVLVTEVPWIAQEIRAYECGEVISERPDEIGQALVRVLGSAQTNQLLRDRARRLGATFDYNRIFSQSHL